MRKYLMKLAFIALLIPVFLSMNAQDLEIKIKADTILLPGGSCVVELNISGGVAPYTYMLFDKEPWEGGKTIEKSGSVYDLTHSFTISEVGSYLVVVRDRNDLTKMIFVKIKAAGTASLDTSPGPPSRSKFI